MHARIIQLVDHFDSIYIWCTNKFKIGASCNKLRKNFAKMQQSFASVIRHVPVSLYQHFFVLVRSTFSKRSGCSTAHNGRYKNPCSSSCPTFEVENTTNKHNHLTWFLTHSLLVNDSRSILMHGRAAYNVFDIQLIVSYTQLHKHFCLQVHDYNLLIS